MNTKKILENLLLSPIHPFLFSMYFVLRLYTFNITGVSFTDFLRPFLISLFATCIIFGVFFLLSKNLQTTSFMASLTLFMFYFYYNAWDFLHAWISFFDLFWICAYLVLSFLIWRGRQRPVSPDLAAGMNLMAIVLLLFPLLQGLRYVIASMNQSRADPVYEIKGQVPDDAPDIYYIILDSYTRSDILRKYGYDDTKFIQSLTDLGFQVAECSQSNYSDTALSLGSSLNMDYLQNLSEGINPQEDDLIYSFNLLENNTVRKSLSKMGYKTVAFSSGFLWAEWHDADLFLAPPRSPMTEFETVVLLSTFARVANDRNYVNFEDLHAENFRRRTRLVLNSFEMLAHEPGPKFVFIHLIVPHAPFAFDENGNPVTPAYFQNDETEGYVTQVKFIDKFILPGLKTLVEESENPPVIILQGDHGHWDTENRMKILNAYHLPKGRENLYPSISPVNSFRVVFNAYFQAELPLLEDVSYYSNQPRYNFSIYPNTCPQ